MSDINKELRKIKRHPAEIPLTVVSVLLTFAFYSVVSFFCVKAATNEEYLNGLMSLLDTDSETVKWLVKFGSWGVVVLIVFIVIRLIYIDKVFIGKSSINSVRLVDSKYANLNNSIIELCKKLNIKKTPIAYIENSFIDSSFLGVKVRSDNAISINANVLTGASSKDDYSYVNYLISRRLAHICLGHNSLWSVVFTFVGKVLPVFCNLYERALCYSADRVVEYLIGKEETMKGIYSTFYNNSLYEEDADINNIIKTKIKTENKSESFGRFLENLFADDPLPNYRLEALLTGKNGRLF